MSNRSYCYHSGTTKMKPKIFLLVGLLWAHSLFGVTDEITINNHHFIVKTKSYDIYDSKGTFMKLYDANSSDKALFRLTLGDATGNCSQRSFEDGSYEIEGDTITLYTKWSRRGKAYLAPLGAKIQKLKVLSNGTLKSISSYVYVEETKRNYDKESGMQYLFHAPKNKEEQEKLSEYIRRMEREYNATFVAGKEAKQLMDEVKNAMKRKLKKTWKRI